MFRNSARWIAPALCAGFLALGAPALAQDDDEAIGFERTPPRLGYLDGEVSFWREGAEDWTPARVNTALASGDALYTAGEANLEIQIGARAFARAGERTQLGLTSLEPDYLQLRVAEGDVSLDLRSLKAGQTLEIDTPNAAFTVERTGYYRVEVDPETTTFTSRRGGRAAVTLASGETAAIAASEQVVVSGGDAPQVETYAAPELDAWDRWNYARTDDQLDAVSARYVPSDVYGVDDLDHHGDWRVVPTYGAIWVPRYVAPGWAPYSTGRWIYDAWYGWTWVDDAPWGWAPYHYGRWVHVSGSWGWCPGPIVVRPYYAPALVAFYGGGGFSVSVRLGPPHIGWVALGWGEPLVPWWGPTRFRRHARWAGWGGPRIVNNVVVQHTTVIDVREVTVFQNAGVRDAIVAVDRDHFGRRSGRDDRFTRERPERVRHLHGDLPVKPDRTSLAAAAGPAQRPPREAWQRSVVATREPRADRAPELAEPRARVTSKPSRERAPRVERTAPAEAPRARVAQPPREGGRIEASKRPPFGRQGDAERRMPPPAPRFERKERIETERPAEAPAVPDARPERGGRAGRERVERAQPERSERAQPERSERARPERGSSAERRERASPSPRELPGEPANRVYPRRQERMESRPRASEPSTRAPRVEGTREERPRQGGGGGSGGSGEKQGRSRGR